MRKRNRKLANSCWTPTHYAGCFCLWLRSVQSISRSLMCEKRQKSRKFFMLLLSSNRGWILAHCAGCSYRHITLFNSTPGLIRVKDLELANSSARLLQIVQAVVVWEVKLFKSTLGLSCVKATGSSQILYARLPQIITPAVFVYDVKFKFF